MQQWGAAGHILHSEEYEAANDQDLHCLSVGVRVEFQERDSPSKGQEVGVTISSALNSDGDREAVVAEDARAFIPRSWSSCSRSGSVQSFVSEP